MKTVIMCLLAASAVAIPPAMAQRPLPNPAPYLESAGTMRQPVEFQFEEFSWAPYRGKSKLYERASFVSGNKAVCVRKIDGRSRPDRDSSVTIHIDGKQAGYFTWWGAHKGGFGYPFRDIKDSPAELTVDKASKSVRYQKPYLLPDGRKAVFSYTLRALPDGRIELAWDIGIPQEEFIRLAKSFSGVQLWFIMPGTYRDGRIFLGSKPYSPQSRGVLAEQKKEKRIPAEGNFRFEPAKNKENGFSIDWGGLKCQVSESLKQTGKKEVYGIVFRLLPKRLAKDRIVIDLGRSSVPAVPAPPAVGGMDFWKMDGLHVPESPTRNLWINPAFEQGLRGWFWGDGGAVYTREPVRFSVVNGGLFGKKALLLRNTQKQSLSLKSFPYALDSGKTYTLSFYAKADGATPLNAALASVSQGGKFVGLKFGNFFGDSHNPAARMHITPEWKRYSRTFTADAGGVHLILSGWNSNVMLDGFQLEQSAAPTEFISDPLDGNLVTANPDNDLVKGKPFGAAFSVTGKPGTKGTVELTVRDAYKELVYRKKLDVAIGEGGTRKIPLELDPAKVDEGIFIVRADYSVEGYRPYTDYYRFSVMAPLSNTHPTRDIFGTSGLYSRVSRGDDLARKYMEWGFGASSHGYRAGSMDEELQKKYRIANYAKCLDGINVRTLREVTPELEKKVEELAFQLAEKYDPNHMKTWALSNEEESSHFPANGLFDDYFKLQHAFAKGVLRANPNAVICPTNGTSGYNSMRGYDAIEGYLKAARKQNFKYGAVGVHPYWSVDRSTLGPNDLDEETARLVAQMKRYGYGKETPVYFTELFNVPWVNIPSWGAGLWADSYRAGGSPTYAAGNREFIHAASAARIWTIMLKYWPQVTMGNIWISRPFMDQHLTPIYLCKAANTMGHLMPWVEYYADARPTGGIRGYVFKLRDGSAIASIWCISGDVENGLKRGPVLDVKFGQPVEFRDLMGARRTAAPGADGITSVRLTPAPLFIKAKDAKLLASALQNAQSDDTTSSISVAMRPTLNGDIAADIRNLTGREQKGTFEIAGRKLPYAIRPGAVETLVIPGLNSGHASGRMYRMEKEFSIHPVKGDRLEREWKMDYFYVPKTDGAPDWSKIPAIRMANRYGKVKKGYPGDLEAAYQAAYDRNNLYLRVTAEDDRFLFSSKLWEKKDARRSLYIHDGCLEVYFDCGANGRSNSVKTYDKDDYRYDFSIGMDGRSGPGMVWRLREVNWQFAGGTDMPTKEEAAKNVKCHFERTAKGYVYTITFPRKYIEPIRLAEGSVAGFALYLHDKDEDADKPGCPKGLSTATEPGRHCDYNPHLWPLMILGK